MRQNFYNNVNTVSNQLVKEECVCTRQNIICVVLPGRIYTSNKFLAKKLIIEKKSLKHKYKIFIKVLSDYFWYKFYLFFMLILE